MFVYGHEVALQTSIRYSAAANVHLKSQQTFFSELYYCVCIALFGTYFP